MLQHSWLQIEIFNKNNFEAVKSKRRPRKRTCPFLQEAVSESPPLEVIMRVLVQVCFLHSWWRSDLTGSLCSTAFFKVNFQGALKMHLSVSVTPRTKSSKPNLRTLLGRNGFFYSHRWKAQEASLLSRSLSLCYHVHTRCPWLRYSAQPIPVNSHSSGYSQQPIFVNCKSLKRLFFNL